MFVFLNLDSVIYISRIFTGYVYTYKCYKTNTIHLNIQVKRAVFPQTNAIVSRSATRF